MVTDRTPNAVLLVLSALLGAVLAGALLGAGPGGHVAQAPPAEGEATPSLSGSFRAATKKVHPSVLNITTERWADNRNNSLVRMMGRFFKQPASASRRLERSFGTGFVVRADGVALTNNHVVANAKRVLARLHDGRVVRAEVIGTDPLSDLAVLRLEPNPNGKPYVPVEFGDSDRLQVGDWVISAGNPFGLDQTITAGIVSAKGRSRVGIAAYEDFIQTDCAINPGNSGGPLLDLKGRVVGVTTAIASRSGQYAGIGFAIPIRMASKIMEELLAHGRVIRGWLGVSIQAANPELLKRLGFGKRSGALLTSVLEGGPAEAAKLRAGDLIVALNGEAVTDGTHLSRLVAETRVGTTLKLTIVRGGKELVLEAQAVERPVEAKPVKPEPKDPPKRKVGINAREITPSLAQYFGFQWTPKDQGVLITRVTPGSMAAQAGIRPGWVLQQLEDKPIRTLDDLDAAQKQIDLSRGVLVRVWDGHSSTFVLLK